MSQELLQVGLTRRSQETFPQRYTGSFQPNLKGEKDVPVTVEFDSLGSARVQALGQREMIRVQRNGHSFEFTGTSAPVQGKAQSNKAEEGVLEGSMTLHGMHVGTFALKKQQQEALLQGLETLRTDVATRPEEHVQSLDASLTGKMDREERLCAGQLLHLYHQTTMEACPLILATGFRKGVPGLLGAGIYFTESAEVTGWKALHWGCLVEVYVQVGHVKDLGNGRVFANGDGRDLGLEMNTMGYDSMTTNLEGVEWAVYYKDQVTDMIAYPCYKNGTKIPGDNCVNDRCELSAAAVPAECNSSHVTEFNHNKTR
jgi:hypothetical protein